VRAQSLPGGFAFSVMHSSYAFLILAPVIANGYSGCVQSYSSSQRLNPRRGTPPPNSRAFQISPLRTSSREAGFRYSGP
jgi:hypothetical protein